MNKIIFSVLMMVSVGAQAQLNTASPMYCNDLKRPCVAMNDIGDYFGQIMNYSSGTWALGYGSSNTSNGTSALRWSNAGVVTIPGTLTVTGAITGTASAVAASGVTAGALGSSVIASSYSVAAAMTAASVTTGGTVTGAAINVSGSGQVLLGNASSTALATLAPGQAKGAIIINSTTGNLCMSTATAVGSWVIVSTPTSACY